MPRLSGRRLTYQVTLKALDWCAELPAMVDRRGQLNEGQLDVLRWIAEGCPHGVMEGHTYKTTALALQNRRLVTVSKKRGVWRAEATVAGQYYLEHGIFPLAVSTPSHSQKKPRRRPRDPASSAQPSSATAKPAAARKARHEQSKRLSVTEQLVADVIAAGGELRINTLGDRTNWEHRARAAVRFGKVPEGKLLVVDRGDSWHELVVRLKDPPSWLTAELEPIDVPVALRKPHSVVAELRDDRDRLRITSASVRARALRLLQALVSAAEARGYGVRSSETRSWGRHARNTEPGHLSIVCRQFGVGVSMRQLIDRTDHTPTVAELRRAERESWYRIPKYDESPSERLSLSLYGGREHRQSVWNDGQSTDIESRLPQVLQEIELRAAVAEEQRLEEERRAAEERRRWEAAMERAKTDLIESHRASHLLNQVTDWRTANHLREYLAALAHVVEAIDDPDKRAAASEWLIWATNHVASLDPLNHDLAMPPNPEPTPEALKPYLRGWSPYGPQRGRGW